MRHQTFTLPTWKNEIPSDFNFIDWGCIISKSGNQITAPPTVHAPIAAIAANPSAYAISNIAVPSTILVTDTISPADDFDLFALNVVAGRTYMFSVYGSGANPLQDSIVALFNNTLTTELGFDDDGGSGTNSLLTYTATFTGQIIIDVEAYPGSGYTGQYTLDVILQPLTDVVDSSFANAVLINPGVSYGFIDSDALDVYDFAGETDTFKINVQAGKFYSIEVAGGADYASDFFDLPPGELDPWIFVYDSNGDLVTQNDDISFPSDISSRVGFFAAQNDTYYLDVQSYFPWTGGYSITLQELDLSSFSPLDAINWFSADNIDVGPGGVVKVYFATPGESFGELADNGIDPLPSFGWNAYEKQQMFQALSEYTKILGFTYVETTNSADAEFRLITTTSEDYGAYFYPQDPDFGDAQGIGAFNVDSGNWDKPGASDFDTPGDQISLQQGGYAFAVMLHELGHAHGLAHPHDNGGGSDVLLGVTGPFDSFGVYDLNQGVYTVMSYNDSWQLHPDGPSPFTLAGLDSGWSGTLSAFDIAVLQQRYGIIHAYATGNNVYTLKDAESAVGTYYETIWDTGGTDEIRYVGTRNAQIDLTAATLDYTATGGGAISYVRNVHGGYTIANGVVIENGTGGSGNDTILGNGAANTLKGNDGTDFLMGRGGADVLNGGNGIDTASYALAAAGVVASLATNTGTGGEAAGDSFISIEKLEGSQFNDTLTGGNGNDTLNGLGGIDTLSGGNGLDTIDGGDGADTITGGNDVDTLTGGAGNDNLDGGNGNDVMNGGADADTLSGGNGLDTMNGGAGADNLTGGNDNDLLNGGAGNDVLSGGNGNDVFSFSEIGGADKITDMTHSDRIDVTLIDAIAGGADNAFTFIGAGAFTNVAGQLRAYGSGGSFFVAGDTNGDGVADFTIQTNILVLNTDLIL